MNKGFGMIEFMLALFLLILITMGFREELAILASRLSTGIR